MTYRTEVLLVGIATGVSVVATIGFWLSGSSSLFAQGIPGICIALGRLTGLFLTLSVWAQFVLSSRAPLLDHVPFVPLRAHRYLGFSTLGLVLAHALFLTAGYSLLADTTAPEQFMRFVLQWEDVGLAVIAVCLLVIIALVSLSRVRARLRYETWYAIHLMVYAIAILAFMHQIQTGDMAAGAGRVFWIGLATAIGFLFAWFRIARPIIFFARHRFRVSRVVAESPSTLSIYISGRRIREFAFEPGQYAQFTFLQRGLSAHHPFSFSLPPGRDELRITVRTSGDFTAKLTTVKPGTYVVIDGPMGQFTRTHGTGRLACFIAGGVGITPIAAMLSGGARPSDVVVIATRSRADAPLVQEILAAVPAARTLFTDEGDPLLDAPTLAKLCPDILSRDIFLCGPPPMMRALMSGLAALGMPAGRIFSEAFMY